MCKKEIVVTNEENMWKKIIKVLDITNNISILLDRDLVKEIKCDKQTNCKEYKEYVWEDQTLTLKEVEGELFEIRRFQKANISFNIPVQPKNTLVFGLAIPH